MLIFLFLQCPADFLDIIIRGKLIRYLADFRNTLDCFFQSICNLLHGLPFEQFFADKGNSTLTDSNADSLLNPRIPVTLHLPVIVTNSLLPCLIFQTFLLVSTDRCKTVICLFNIRILICKHLKFLLAFRCKEMCPFQQLRLWIFEL